MAPPDSDEASAPREASPDFRVLCFQPQLGYAPNREYRKRAKHQKVKSGCLTCKSRRIKCDEAKPRCSRCLQRSLECQWPKLKSGTGARESLSPLNFSDSSSPQASPGRSWTMSLAFGNSGDVEPCCGISAPALLHHFREAFQDMQFASTADIDGIVSMGFSQPFLLNSILALSASHLRHHTIDDQSSRISEHFRQSLAISEFGKALQRKSTTNRSDALLLTCMILGVLTFSIIDQVQPESSWLFSDDPNRLNWFYLNLGLKPLLLSAEQFRGQSSLQWMYDRGDDEQHTFFGTNRTLDRVPAHWRTFLGLTGEAANVADGAFREPARLLAEITRLQPTSESFYLYVNFFSGIDLGDGFCQLLASHDERAVWVLGYWMGLMCRFDCWWTRYRTEMEWKAARIWLEGLQWGDEVRQKMMSDLQNANRWIPYT